MRELVLIVEGHGDVVAMPHVVAKVGVLLGMPLYADNPIRARGWGAIKKSGGLEQFIHLAANRPGCQKVLIIVDLDDGCPIEEREIVAERVSALQERYGITIELCFCIREFEAWILASLENFENSAFKGAVEFPIVDHDQIRDAKGRLRKILQDGYSETADQGDLAKQIDPRSLYLKDRSFRRFVKALTGFGYEDLEALIA